MSAVYIALPFALLLALLFLGLFIWSVRSGQMDDLEESLDALDDLGDALRLVIRVEGSEINQVFRSVVSATDSEFVRSLEAFRSAEAKHIAYACERIPQFAPELADECRRLRISHSRDAGAKLSSDE